jgi:phage-related protein
VYQGQMVLLHGFVKKTQQTQQTPEEELDLAVKRQKEVESGKTAK